MKVINERINAVLMTTLLGVFALGGCDEDAADGGQADEVASEERITPSLGVDRQIASEPRSGASAPAQRRFVPGQVIVKFREEVSPARQTALMQVDGFRTRALRATGTGAMVWSLEPAEPLEFSSIADEEDYMLAAIEAVRDLPEVEYAQEDAYMRFFATPSDTLYNQQWHYTSAKFPQAWDTATGGVKIAVLDSGRLDHPDLAGRWTAGYNALTGTADAFDYGVYYHGLLVAGILGARTNNGAGIAATCWNCMLMPVRVSDDFGSPPTMSAASAGIAWAANNGARVINMSFGTDATPQGACTNHPALQDAVNLARSKGVVVVAAAGNDGMETANVSPASCSGVIAVGATGKNGAFAGWSNKGSRLDVLAPGGDLHNKVGWWGYSERFFGEVVGCPVGTEEWASGKGGALSAWAVRKPGQQPLAGDYCYRYAAGTSLSAPHVAGLAALLLSQRPELTPNQVAARIKSTATPVGGCGNGCVAGRIDAAAAVYPPVPERGMWYNPARSGNGIEIHPRPGNDQVSLLWLTYTATETPIWYRAELAPGAGGWEGSLLKSTWNGSSASTQTVGTARLRRTNGQWRYEWTLNGASGNEPIQRLAFGAGPNYMQGTGLWHNKAQPGWWIDLESKGTTHVANLLIYSSGGQPIWLQGIVDDVDTSLDFSLTYIRGKNLCPGCVGSTSLTGQAAGWMRIQGAGGAPQTLTASTGANFPGGSWHRLPFTLTRLTGP